MEPVKAATVMAKTAVSDDISTREMDKYRRILDGMRDAFVLFNPQGGLVEWNTAFVEMLGYSAEELSGLTSLDLTPRKWQDADARIFLQQTMLDGQSHLYEKEYIRKDGGLLPVELKAHLLRNQDGQAEAMWVVVRDISERKRAELALREQEEFFRLVAENSGDFIAVLDRDGRRLYNSPSYKLFFGDTRQLHGTDSFAEIHPDDQARIKLIFDQTVNSGIGQTAEFRFVLPDGSIRQMESRAGVIRDDDGRVFRVVVVSNDITERKQAEDKIFSLAFYDGLTHLPNRRMLSERLHQAMAATRRSGRYGALMFLDLDDFKPVNDAYGHGVGDRLLNETARRITKCLREIDTVARFGGDEFVILLNELDSTRDDSAAQASIVAEKIRIRLAEPYTLSIRQEGEADIQVGHRCTSSIGVVLFHSFEYREEDLLRCADIAMYEAKDDGGNRISLCDMKMLKSGATEAD